MAPPVPARYRLPRANSGSSGRPGQGWPRRGEARTNASRLAEAWKSAPHALRLARLGSLTLFSVSRDADSTASPHIGSATWFQVNFILLPEPCPWGSHWLSCLGLPAAAGPGPAGPPAGGPLSAQLRSAARIGCSTLMHFMQNLAGCDQCITPPMKCQLNWQCCASATRNASLNIFIPFVPCRHLELFRVFNLQNQLPVRRHRPISPWFPVRACCEPWSGCACAR